MNKIKILYIISYNINNNNNNMLRFSCSNTLQLEWKPNQINPFKNIHTLLIEKSI